MNNEGILDILRDQIDRILTFWERPAVRNQLVAIIFVIVGVLFVERLLTTLLYRRINRRINPELKRQPIEVHVLRVVQRLLLPVLGLVVFSVMIGRFADQGLLTGLLGDMLGLFWQIFYFRVFVALGYELFDGVHWRRLHLRLLTPFFWIIIFGEALADLINWQRIANYVLGGLDNPLTLGTLVVAIFLLYAWIDSVIQIQDVIQATAIKYTRARQGTVEATLTLVRYVLLAVGVYLFLINIGLNATTVAAITGGLSVGIGFGLQAVVSNFVSGIILLLEGSIQPGDILTIDNDRADVKKLGIRSTIVSTDDGTEILIPNSQLFTSQVTQRTGSHQFIRTILYFHVSNKSDPDEVLEVLEATARSHAKVSHEPAPPSASIYDMADYYIQYRLEVWTDHRIIGPVGMRKQLNYLVYKAFVKHDIQDPVPERDLLLHWQESPSAPEGAT